MYLQKHQETEHKELPNLFVVTGSAIAGERPQGLSWRLRNCTRGTCCGVCRRYECPEYGAGGYHLHFSTYICGDHNIAKVICDKSRQHTSQKCAASVFALLNQLLSLKMCDGCTISSCVNDIFQIEFEVSFAGKSLNGLKPEFSMKKTSLQEKAGVMFEEIFLSLDQTEVEICMLEKRCVGSASSDSFVAICQAMKKAKWFILIMQVTRCETVYTTRSRIRTSPNWNHWRILRVRWRNLSCCVIHRGRITTRHTLTWHYRNRIFLANGSWSVAVLVNTE